MLLQISQWLSLCSDHKFLEEQEAHLLAICQRTMALPVGRWLPHSYRFGNGSRLYINLLIFHVQGYVHVGSLPAPPHSSPGYPSAQLEWACPSKERQRRAGSHGEAGRDDGVGGVSQWSSCRLENISSFVPGQLINNIIISVGTCCFVL